MKIPFLAPLPKKCVFMYRSLGYKYVVICFNEYKKKNFSAISVSALAPKITYCSGSGKARVKKMTK